MIYLAINAITVLPYIAFSVMPSILYSKHFSVLHGKVTFILILFHKKVNKNMLEISLLIVHFFIVTLFHTNCVLRYLS